MSTDLTLIIPLTFNPDADRRSRRVFEDAVDWCSAQTDDRLWWLRHKIASRLERGSFVEERLFRRDPRENTVFLMIVAANLRALRDHFDGAALPQGKAG
ncbi:MAG: hypothetical protein KF684_04270 [Phycisphaeraceae bacterium]|nr:hypothetical protein [Phycisphaeraceae bacterium]